MKMSRCCVVDAAGICVGNDCTGSRICRDGKCAAGSAANDRYMLVAIEGADSEQDAIGNDLSTNLATGVRRAMNIDIGSTGQNRCELCCVERLLFRKPVIGIAAVLCKTDLDGSIGTTKSPRISPPGLAGL
jgi:hypothetical protein